MSAGAVADVPVVKQTPDAHHAPKGTWLAVTATLLAGLSPVLLVVTTPLSPASSDAWVWACLITVLVGFRYAWLVEQGTTRLFEVVVWLFAYVFLGLAPLAQMRTGTYPATTPAIDPTRNSMTMLVVGVSLIAFILGLLLGGRRTARIEGAARTVSEERVRLLAAMSLLAGLYYAGSVGLGSLFSNRAARYDAELAHWPNSTVAVVVRAAATWPLLVSVVALLVLRRRHKARGERAPTLLLWVVFIALVIIVNPVTSPRYVIGTALLSVIVAFGAAGSPPRFRVFALVIAMGLVFVFPYADVARNSNQQGSSKVGGPAQVLTTGDFDAVDQINNTLAYVDIEGNTHGGQLSGAMLFWVPRFAWPNKPEDTGIVLADFRGYQFKNLSAPLTAELFIDGGWPLLIGGMLALGWAIRLADRRIARRVDRRRTIGIFGLTLPFYLIIVLRGSLLQAMAGLTVLVACGLFVTAKEPVAGSAAAG